MNESNNKKRTIYNQDIISLLADKYNTTIQYVRQTLRGDRGSKLAENLRKEYKRLDTEAKKAIRKSIKTNKS